MQVTSYFLVSHLLQKSIYVQQKKETHSGLKLTWSKWRYKYKTLWQNRQTDDIFLFLMLKQQNTKMEKDSLLLTTKI